jgi:hypothetical protein
MKTYLQQTKQESKITLSSGNSIASLQPKLKVNKPGDRYEVEADRIADEIMRMEPKREGSSGYGNALQQECA